MTQPLSLPDLLRTVADAWVLAGTADRASLARLGRAVVNDSSFFTRLENPQASTTTATLERFARFLLDPANWPDGRVVQEAREFAHRLGVTLAPAHLATGQSGDLSGQAVTQ